MTELTAAQLGRDLGLIEEQVGELHEHIVGYFRARYHGEAYSAVGEQGEAASDDAPGDEAGDAAFSRLMDQGFEEVNAAVVADLRRRMPQMLAERRAARVGFDAHLYARWQRAIYLYEAILTLA